MIHRALRWTSHKADGTDANVEVIGIDRKALAALAKSGMTRERWTSCLAVRVVADHPRKATDMPPLLGTYQIEGDVIRFVPRFPLEPGLRYRAELEPARLHEIAGTTAQRPGPDGSSHRSRHDYRPISRLRSGPLVRPRPSATSIRPASTSRRTCSDSTSISPPR